MEDENRTEHFEGLEPIQEDSGLGSISINNEVVANIVAMAAREVPGVVSLASGSIKDDIAGLFGSRRESGSSVAIREEADGSYHISVKLILSFGVQLAKVAQSVQVAVRDRVENMTNKEVSKVNIIVDGVRQEETEPGRETSEV
ncbi:MAG: Asp23/Gls24 family envelope stress response protein [Oceanipulchritudo sp.]